LQVFKLNNHQLFVEMTGLVFSSPQRMVRRLPAIVCDFYLLRVQIPWDASSSNVIFTMSTAPLTIVLRA
jgi:hypothetical protein